jgi:ATP-binding cassette subfamily B protein
MKKNTDQKNKDIKPKVSLFAFLKPYLSLTIPLFIVSIAANGLGLFIPREVSSVLDYLQKNDMQSVMPQLYKIGILSGIILVVSFLQSFVAAFASEYVARDIRKKLTKKLSSQSYRYIAEKTSSTLLTVFTSDVDAVKGIVSQALVAIFSAILLLIGSIFALLSINVVLTLITLAVVPFIVLTFALVFGRLKEFFTEAQKNLERINKVINESIVAASLVRVLHSQ